MNLDFSLYLNIFVGGVLLLGFLGGFIRGTKKTLYKLLVTLVFYIVFFITIEDVAAFLLTFDLGFIKSSVEPFLPVVVSGEFTIYNIVQTFIVENASSYTAFIEATNMDNFILGVSTLVVKIIYLVVYFTVISILYRFFVWLIKSIFFGKSKKRKLKEKKIETEYYELTTRKGKKEVEKRNKIIDKKNEKLAKRNKPLIKKYVYTYTEKEVKKEYKKLKRKARLTGGLLGLVKASMRLFILITIFGGFTQIVNTLVTTSEDVVASEDIVMSLEHTPLYIMSEGIVDFEPYTDQITIVQDAISAFDENMFVSSVNEYVTFSSPLYDGPLSTYLFDQVLSFTFNEEEIVLREELDLIASSANTFLHSKYNETNNIADLETEELASIISNISESTLIIELIPSLLEGAINHNGYDLDLTYDELNEYDWSKELNDFGVVAATGLTFAIEAGLLEDGADMNAVPLDGEALNDVLVVLAESRVVTEAGSVMMSIVLDSASEDIKAFIDPEASIDWTNELKAFGSVSETIFNNDVTLGDLTSGDINNIITVLKGTDLTVLLDSGIITNALVTIFTDMTADETSPLVIPANVVYRDVLDSEGNIIEQGELRSILQAMNSLTSNVETFDLNGMDMSLISSLDSTVIDNIVESKIFVATISSFVTTTDLGEFSIVIEDEYIDTEGYIVKEEMKRTLNSFTVLLDELICTAEDLDCVEGDIEVTKLFSLDSSTLSTMLESNILHATMGSVVYSMGGEFMIFPSDIVDSIIVNELPKEIVSKEEINNVIEALSLLGFTDLDNMNMDGNIFNGVASDTDPTKVDEQKLNTLLSSKILYATISDMILSLGVDGSLTVPELSLGNEVVVEEVNGISYITFNEFKYLLEAIISLDAIELTGIDLAMIIDKKETLMQSSLFHATVSKMLLDLDSGVVAVPTKDSLGNDLVTVIGDTTYINKPELYATLDGLKLLGLVDMTTFSGGFDLSLLSTTETQDLLLSSATLHLTISNSLKDVAGVITVPDYDVDGTSIKTTVDTYEYINKDEIKALINAINVMGFSDINNVSVENTSVFFGHTDTLLQSASLHATLSDNLISSAGTSLLLPDSVKVTGLDATVFISKTEITNLFNAFDTLNIGNFDDFDFSPSIIFGIDSNVLFASESLQLTVSDLILATASDETAASGSTALIIPTALREDVLLNGVNKEQVLKTELISLLQALEVLNLTNFSDSIDSSIITSLTNTELQTMLSSGTMHVTIDNMLKGNSAVSSNVPVLALETNDYAANILTSEEIIRFISATKAMLGDTADFATVSFDVSALIGLDDASRSVVLDSYIVRNTLTPALETMALNPLKPYALDSSHYMNSDNTTFLTKQAALDIIVLNS